MARAPLGIRLIALVALLAAGPAEAFDITYLGQSKTDLGNPHDIKLSPAGDRLFVSDVDNDRVVILDADSLDMIAAFGADHQNGTHDVDFGPDGRVYVADTHNHRIAIYELEGDSGRLVAELSGGFRKPEGVLVAADGTVYVTGAGSHNLLAFVNGEAIKELDGLSSPHDIAFAPNGDLWLADAANDRVVRVNEDLKILGILGGAPYEFRGPRYLDVAPDGTLIVADKYSHSVKVISEAGELVAKLGAETPGLGPDGFRTPEGVELDGDRLWIADSGNDRIVKFKVTWD